MTDFEHTITQYIDRTHRRYGFINEGSEIQSQLIKDLEEHAIERERTNITWDEFIVANEMWHDDGILTDGLFRSDIPLLDVINDKWNHHNYQKLEDAIKDLLSM